MSDNTINGLHAALKALKEVVAPAVDAGNPLANEQLKLVCGYLTMVCARLPYRHERQRFELAHWTRLGHGLAEAAAQCSAEVASALRRALDQADGLAIRPDANERELQAATAALNAAISALVRVAAAADGATRGHIERSVVAAAKAWLDLRRAWFLPLGFDPEPGRLPPIDSAIKGIE